jgi:hypothetical protein
MKDASNNRENRWLRAPATNNAYVPIEPLTPSLVGEGSDYQSYSSPSPGSPDQTTEYEGSGLVNRPVRT